MKVNNFRIEIHKCYEGKNRNILHGGGGPIPVPYVVGRPEKQAKH